MSQQSAAMPLHTYQSPNGNGLCTYDSAGKVCGRMATAIEHLTVRSAGGFMNPVVALIESHDYIPPQPGTLAAEGDACGFGLQAGGVCGASPASHARHAPAEFRPIDPVRRYLDEQASAAHQTYHGATFPVDSPPTTAQVVAMFNDQALRLAVAKNAKYRDAWRKQGWQGNVGRILSKSDRLRAMLWTDEPLLDNDSDESVRDTLLDLANLCAFAAQNLADENRWGQQ